MRYGTTEDFAALRLVKAQSVRAGYCRQGHYFGVKPVKLPNGRLAWPLDDNPQPAARGVAK